MFILIIYCFDGSTCTSTFTHRDDAVEAWTDALLDKMRFNEIAAVSFEENAKC